jgi:MFS family permease
MKQIYLANLHFALRAVGSSVADIFGMVFLYERGLELWTIFLTYAAIQGIPLLIRPFMAWIGMHVGLKRTIIIGTLLYAGNYIFLSQIHSISPLFFAFILYSSISSVAYWTAFHIYFSKLSSKERRGGDVTSREIFVTILQVMASGGAGFAIVAFGFSGPFIAATLITLTAAIPLLFLPDVPIPSALHPLTFFRKMDWRAFIATFANGWIEIAHAVVWPFVVFLLFKDYVIAGLLASLVIIVKVAGLLTVGGFIDKGKRYVIYTSALLLVFITTIGRALFVSKVPEAIFFDIVYAISLCFFSPVLDTLMYDSIDEAENVWQFEIGLEGAYDLGALSVWLLGALIAFNNMNIQYTVALGLVGLIVITPAFRSFYAVSSTTVNQPKN